MNIVVTERDKKLLRLVACLAIIVIFGMYLIRPAMKNHETLQNEYDAAETEAAGISDADCPHLRRLTILSRRMKPR